MATDYAYGGESWMSVAEETTWGTWTDSGREYMRMHGESMKIDKGVKAITSVMGTGASISRVVEGFNKSGGDVQPEGLYEGGLWVMMKHAFGDVTTVTDSPVAGANTHTFNLETQLPEGLSVEISKGNFPTGKVWQFPGCRVKQLQFNFTPEDLIRFVFTLVAKSGEQNLTASGTPTYAGEYPVYWFHCGPSITLNGHTTRFKNGSITMNNSVADDRFLFSRTISEPYRVGKREVRGQFTLEFDSMDLIDDIMDQTESSLQIVMTSDLMVTGSTPYSILVTATKIRLTGDTPVVNTEGIIEYPVSFLCRASAGENSEFAVQLINGETSI